MSDPSRDSGTGGAAEATATPQQGPPGAPAGGKRKKSPSMHEGIAVWCDCCSCEAEPYWVEIAKEMGMELGSDYEDADG